MNETRANALGLVVEFVPPDGLLDGGFWLVRHRETGYSLGSWCPDTGSLYVAGETHGDVWSADKALNLFALRVKAG